MQPLSLPLGHLAPHYDTSALTGSGKVDDDELVPSRLERRVKLCQTRARGRQSGPLLASSPSLPSTTHQCWSRLPLPWSQGMGVVVRQDGVSTPNWDVRPPPSVTFQQLPTKRRAGGEADGMA